MKTMMVFLFAVSLSTVVVMREEKKSPFEGIEWLVGGWARIEGEKRMEECWLPAKGGVMLGLHRDVFSEKKAFFEYLRIGIDGEDLVYYASPLGKKTTPFHLKSLAEGRVVFENPDHDYPQRIIYSLKGKATLVARIEGLRKGEMKSSQWEWKKTDIFR